MKKIIGLLVVIILLFLACDFFILHGPEVYVPPVVPVYTLLDLEFEGSCSDNGNLNFIIDCSELNFVTPGYDNPDSQCLELTMKQDTGTEDKYLQILPSYNYISLADMVISLHAKKKDKDIGGGLFYANFTILIDGNTIRLGISGLGFGNEIAVSGEILQINDTEWHHYLLIFKNNRVQVIIDDTFKVIDQVLSSEINLVVDEITVGYSTLKTYSDHNLPTHTGFSFNGYIDNFTIYSYEKFTIQ